MTRPRRTAPLPSGTAASVVVGALGVLVAVPACYLAVLSLAARRPLRPAGGEAGGPLPRLAVLVPAHDEAQLIARCVTSLRGQDYPEDRRSIVVVADNCSDATAALARGAGADVLVRTAPNGGGKGAALRWAIDQWTPREDPDAFVVVDADSVTDAGLLRALAVGLRAGADAVQGEYLALPEAGTRSELRSAAFLLFHRVRFRGRAALGLPCSLVGNGMLLSRELVQRHPWNAVTAAEDLEYSTDLRLHGVRPLFAPQARLSAPVSAAGEGARTQRLRWEGGRWHVVRTRLPLLVRGCCSRRAPELWDAALDLSTPPLGVLAGTIAAGTALTAVSSWMGVLRVAALGPWAVALIALPVHVLVGLRAAGAPRSTFRALLSAPSLVLGDLVVRTALLRGSRADTWQRTARPGDVAPPVPGPSTP